MDPASHPAQEPASEAPASEAPDLTRRSGKTKRAPVIMDALHEAYEGGRVELDWETPFQLLVATILSAQSTDKKVNQITPTLFARYPDPAAIAAADEAELEALLRPTGFYRQKTKAVQGVAAALLEDHGGEVPATMAELVALPGVARKTANVVQSAAFPEAHARDPEAGIAVDTHVLRLSRRLGFTTHTDPTKIERDLMRLWPRARWASGSLVLILHGRRVCDAQRPRCADCLVEHLCPSSQLAGCRDKAGQARALG